MPVKGIKADSALNVLKYYHVCTPGRAPCIAHDYFEGIVQYDLWLALDDLVRRWKLKIGLINRRLNKNHLSAEDPLFIPDIRLESKTKRITGTASQIRRLLLILPLIMFDLVKDFHDPVWKMILKLRELCCIVCSPALSHDQAALLKSEIETYLVYRLNYFQKIDLRPKHEFILHYPELTLYFGPLKHLWTLRCESKHSYFKRLIEAYRNYKNITQMLAEKHELMQCTSEEQYEAFVLCEDPVDFTHRSINNDVNALIVNFCANSNVSIKYTSDKVEFKGISYAKGMSICVEKNAYGNYVVCEIDEMLISNDLTNLYFHGSTRELIFNTDVGVYEIAEYKGCENRSQKLCIFSHFSLLSADPLPQSHIKFIPVWLMKYAPFNAGV